MPSGDSFVNPIFFMQLVLAVAVETRAAWCRVPSLKHLSSLYTLTNHKGWCMSNAISMRCPGDLRQAFVIELSKVILCLVATRFEHSTLLVRTKQHNHSRQP